MAGIEHMRGSALEAVQALRCLVCVANHGYTCAVASQIVNRVRTIVSR